MGPRDEGFRIVNAIDVKALLAGDEEFVRALVRAARSTAFAMLSVIRYRRMRPVCRASQWRPGWMLMACR